MKNDTGSKKPSGGFVALLLITALSGVAWLPYAFSALDSLEKAEENMLFIILYPIYSLLSIYLSYKCYNGRRALAWILIGLVWLSLVAEVMLLRM